MSVKHQSITVNERKSKDQLAFQKEAISISLDKFTQAKYLNDCILHRTKKGQNDFVIQVLDSNTYPNACVPLAGIIDFYRQKGIRFDIQYQRGSYAKHVRLDCALQVEDPVNDNELIYPLDKVWTFSSSEGVGKLVDAISSHIRKADLIESGIVSSIEWCINEAMDNVLQHSSCDKGYVMGQLHKATKMFAICIFDTGIGIFNSLRNTPHKPPTAFDAITMAMQERVTRDTSVGQGNGLWGLSNIVNANGGSIRISSCGARYSHYDGQPTKVMDGDFNLGSKQGTTMIDFRLDYAKPINIAEALAGYEPTDLVLEEHEDDEENITIVVSKEAHGTGTRQSAEKLRNFAENLRNEKKKRLIFDFEGVNIVSSSFADELVGKILAKNGFVGFMQNYRIKNLSSINAAIINRSVEQRMAQKYYDHHVDEEM